jgi:hypothetical protein
VAGRQSEAKRILSEYRRAIWKVAHSAHPRKEAKKYDRALRIALRKRLPSENGPDLFSWQRGLRIFLAAPTRGPLREWDLVGCPLGGTLAAGRCIDRREARIASGRARYANPESGGWEYPECRRCAVGAGYRERMRGYVPAPFRNYNAASCARQRAAQRKQSLTEVDVPSLDEPPTARKG